MKDLAHFFTRDDVEAYVLQERPEARISRNFEFIAAMMMQRVYENQWGAPVMIGYYITDEYARVLKAAEQPTHDLYAAVFAHGIQEDHPIDFLLANLETRSLQRFQLKTFGARGQTLSTENLIQYLNKIKNKYAKSEDALLVAITEVDKVDIQKVNEGLEKTSFPFDQLLLVGVFNDDFVIAGLLPDEGWTTLPLRDVVL